MAEQEVIKHTKKIYRIWRSNEHGTWHRIKENLLEIIIIVFAITLSGWLHNRSEHNHEQKNVKAFLTGLRSDLNRDITEMEGDKIAYTNQQAVFRYVVSLKPEEPVNKDSIISRRTWLFNTTELNPNNGRFEGFKSSGKIGNIENEELQNDIMDLYQENIPHLLSGTAAYIVNKKKFIDYSLENNKRLTDSTTNFDALLHTDVARNISISLSNASEVLSRYDSCIVKMKKIITAIDREYK